MDKHITLIADPVILSVPVHENNEPLIDLRTTNTIQFGPSPEIPNNTNYTKMRQTVHERLLKAESYLPTGMKFCLYEAYRSLNVQKMIFEARYADVKHHHPNLNHREVFIKATELISPVTNLDGSTNVPPHSTGAAIDVYLIDSKGNPLDMGIHPKDWLTDTDGNYSVNHSNRISNEAKKHRQIMNNALEHAGFVNYPTEYWHWSYGDRYWAYHKNQPYAIYGSI